MAVLVEAFSVIVRRPAIAERFKGGWAAFQSAIPNGTGCCDDDLFRVAFLSPDDVKAFVSILEAGGLVFHRSGEAVDITVVDQLRGPTGSTPWLQVDRIEHGNNHCVAASLVGRRATNIAVPRGWKFEGSLSDHPSFAAEGTEGDRLKSMRHENGNDVYLDLVTGKEVFVGRPTIQGDTEAALFTQLEKICKDASNLGVETERLEALGDEEGAAPLFEELEERLLPRAERIVDGAGADMAFAHFARGLILSVLNRRDEAESALRTANRLQPGVINTLRELVRCLGKEGRYAEALPFASEAVEVAPVDAGAWGNLATCLIQCGEREEGRKAIDYAIDLDPAHPLNRYIRDNFETYFA